MAGNKNLLVMLGIIVAIIIGYYVYKENSGTKVELNIPGKGTISGKISD